MISIAELPSVKFQVSKEADIFKTEKNRNFSISQGKPENVFDL